MHRKASYNHWLPATPPVPARGSHSKLRPASWKLEPASSLPHQLEPSGTCHTTRRSQVSFKIVWKCIKRWEMARKGIKPMLKIVQFVVWMSYLTVCQNTSANKCYGHISYMQLFEFVRDPPRLHNSDIRGFASCVAPDRIRILMLLLETWYSCHVWDNWGLDVVFFPPYEILFYFC